MQTVTEFIDQLEDEKRTLFLILHDLLTKDFKLVPKLKYKIPFYYGTSWVCYLNPKKPLGLELCFLRGNEMKSKAIHANGRKQIKGIFLTELSDSNYSEILEAIKEAVELDADSPYKSPGRKR